MVSSSDGRHPSLTRSISWAASEEPLYKEVKRLLTQSLIEGEWPAGAVLLVRLVVFGAFPAVAGGAT